MSKNRTPSGDAKPPLWAMIVVALVLLIAVVGYFFKY